MWLVKWMPRFLEAQDNASVKPWVKANVCTEFCKVWPLDEPTADEVAAAGSIEAARKGKRDTQDEVSTFNCDDVMN